jgi:F-type H+-transporting ATPase subunit delta
MIKQRQFHLISRSYATALFNAAVKAGIGDQVAEQLQGLAASLQNVKSLRAYYDDPQISTEAKIGLLDKVFKGRIAPMLLSMLHLLVRRDRTHYLREILDYYHLIHEQAAGIEPAIVVTAHELGFQDKLRLKTALERFSKKKLDIDFSVDRELIGGLIFRYKDTLIDTSISSGLESLRRRLSSVQVN